MECLLQEHPLIIPYFQQAAWWFVATVSPVTVLSPSQLIGKRRTIFARSSYGSSVIILTKECNPGEDVVHDQQQQVVIKHYITTTSGNYT